MPILCSVIRRLTAYLCTVAQTGQADVRRLGAFDLAWKATMKTFRWPVLATSYIATLLVFLAADALWLGVLMGPTYAGWLGPMMLAQPRLAPAAAFYVLIGIGLLVFAVLPGLRSSSVSLTARLAALLGLLAYGTYDLTNYATLRDWPLALTLIDLAWGTFLCCLAGCAGHLAARRLRP